MSSNIRLIVADDHHLVRKGIVSLLSILEEVEVVREAANGTEVLAWLRSPNEADMALLDLEMPEMDGIATLKVLRESFPQIPVIILTMLPDPRRLREAIEEGASGVLFKTAALQELQQAINRVHLGHTYFATEVASLLLSPQNEKVEERLSPRELEILKLVAAGLSSTEIGEKLFISPRTVDTHRNNLIQKLEVNGIAGLVRFAIENHLI